MSNKTYTIFISFIVALGGFLFGFDAGIIGINYLNQNETIDAFLKPVKILINGFTFKSNGLLTKPVSVMQIEKLGMLKNIKLCNDID